MKKHVREAWEAIVEVATLYGVQVRHITRGRHPDKAVLTYGADRHVIGLPGSPNCTHWTVVVARKQAMQACRIMTGR